MTAQTKACRMRSYEELSMADTGLSQIGQIAINVHDTNRATEFYRDKLGMKHLFSAGTLAFFDCNGVRLMLSPPEKPEFDHPSSIIYFKVDDIGNQYEAMQARGVQFEDKPHVVAAMPTYDLWMTFFRDSENNLLGLMSEVKR
jgi:catechol 2,3-dioxygenase-like lactoylglutathione lyase family enzyme